MNWGYHGRAGVRKPLVSEQNRLKRLSWCNERRNWKKEWENVVWSDESRYLLFQNDSNHWVWREPKEKHDVDCLLPTVKQGSPGIMVWGAFISNKIGPLVIIRENVNAKKYLEILQEHLLPFYVSLGNEMSTFSRMITRLFTGKMKVQLIFFHGQPRARI